MAATYVLVHGGGHGGWCRLWDLDTAHDMMITEPGWVAEKLILVAAGV